MIENPTKQIVHPQTLLSSVEVSRDTISLGYGQAFVGDGWGPISSGFPLIGNRNYQVVKIMYENTYSFAEYGTPAAVIDTFWARPSASNSLKEYADTFSTAGFPNNIYHFDYFDMTPSVSISNFDALNKTIKTQGYYYHFIKRYSNIGSVSFNFDPEFVNDYWLPINPEIDTARMPVSLYLIDSLQIV